MTTGIRVIRSTTIIRKGRRLEYHNTKNDHLNGNEKGNDDAHEHSNDADILVLIATMIMIMVRLMQKCNHSRYDKNSGLYPIRAAINIQASNAILIMDARFYTALYAVLSGKYLCRILALRVYQKSGSS